MKHAPTPCTPPFMFQTVSLSSTGSPGCPGAKSAPPHEGKTRGGEYRLRRLYNMKYPRISWETGWECRGVVPRSIPTPISKALLDRYLKTTWTFFFPPRKFASWRLPKKIQEECRTGRLCTFHFKGREVHLMERSYIETEESSSTVPHTQLNPSSTSSPSSNFH